MANVSVGVRLAWLPSLGCVPLGKSAPGVDRDWHDGGTPGLVALASVVREMCLGDIQLEQRVPLSRRQALHDDWLTDGQHVVHEHSGSAVSHVSGFDQFKSACAGSAHRDLREPDLGLDVTDYAQFDTITSTGEPARANVGTRRPAR
jgi:hypothetical protein